MEAYGPRNAQERTWQVVEAVREIADGRDVPMSWVALAWVADRPTVSSVILGARTVAQLDENLGAAGLHLSDEETQRLTAVSAPLVADYPYGTAGVEQRSRELG
jgi:aryl-alcohol dehydrogenase-like predicted oxidoreductase